jgi:addiction module HigA family antidote
MKMHNPPHPGEVLKALCVEPLNLTVTEVARSLGVSRKTLSAILNGRAVSLSPSRRRLKAGLINDFNMICGMRNETGVGFTLRN